MPAIPDEGEVPVNLEDCSWNMIRQLVQADTFKNYYKVGDIKSITLSSGEVVYMQVASINDGSGDAGVWYPKGTVDFISRDSMQTKYGMNATDTASGGWIACSLRQTLNSAIFSTLPIELQNVVIEKEHMITCDSSLKQTLDKLWLPTLYEVMSKEQSSDNAYHNKQYGIFTNSSSRVKHIGNNGVAAHWRLSTQHTNQAFQGIGTTGEPYTAGSYQYAGSKHGVPICFRVG